SFRTKIGTIIEGYQRAYKLHTSIEFGDLSNKSMRVQLENICKRYYDLLPLMRDSNTEEVLTISSARNFNEREALEQFQAVNKKRRRIVAVESEEESSVKKGKKRATHNFDVEKLLEANKKFTENVEKSAKVAKFTFASKFADLITSGKTLKEAAKIIDICEQLSEGKSIRSIRYDDDEERSSIRDKPSTN
ncbi:hypothetical protein CU098_008371, partial [Rhizopus stolonifer]